MKIRKTEAGQGGKTGHSNMTHWSYTAIVKAESKRIRRTNDKLLIAESRKDA